MKEQWDVRYAVDQYVYGKTPNSFFKENIDKLDYSARILFPAEGEGRNAVYASMKGHMVTAYDLSREGKRKALRLAGEEGVNIDYYVGELHNLEFTEESFDLAVLISAHFHPSERESVHRQIAKLVKKGGLVILEGFSTNNLEIRKKNPAVGGPPDLEMLFTREMIREDFPGFEVVILEEREIELKEGIHHNGTAKVIRFIGRKRK